MKSIWQIKTAPLSEVALLSKELGVSDLIAKLLWLRGFTTPENATLFLNQSLKDLPNPFLLKDMEKAVDLITTAVKNKKKIVVYGDYDVDGTISSSLLFLFFKECGYPIDFYIPHRIEEGYSLNIKALHKLKERGFDLIITVDNGISAHKECEVARDLGFTVIVTDHHHVPETLPVADAIVNPQRRDCAFPAKEICGAGVAFFLMMALRSRWRESGFFSDKQEPNLTSYLDLLSIATVADVVPLRGVNRIIVQQGLKVLTRTRWEGLKALKNVSKIESADSFDLGFKLGPRLNACGRLYDASTGVKMLTTELPQLAQTLALELDKANRERRLIESEILEQAKEAVLREENLRHGYVLSDDRWHPGVIGIVASRLVEQFHRPFILLGKDGDFLKGSARSLSQLSMVDALNECATHLIKFGGHKAAAGMTLHRDNLVAFTESFDAYVKSKLTESDYMPKLDIDSSLDLGDLNQAYYESLQVLKPFGMGNAEPLFMSEGVKIQSKQIVGEKHLKLKVGDYQVPAIAFGKGFMIKDVENSVDIAYQLTWDSWADCPGLIIRDIHT